MESDFEDKTKSRFVGFCQDEISVDDSALTPGVYYHKNKTCRNTRQMQRRRAKRFVFKNGEINIENEKSARKYLITNCFVTMVEARWRWTLLNFFMAFTLEWLFFGFIYWIIALKHGDLTDDHLPNNENGTEWIPCIDNIYGFTSSFLFSVEVHTTVAYGHRAITLQCPQAITAMCLQCILSSIFQAFMIGILFAKLTRPKARAQTILFSKRSVVTLRDEKLCLIFRVGDMRISRLLNIKVFAYLIKVDENILENYEQIELKTELVGNESTFFLWPASVSHVIDEHSPLYKISAAELLCGNLEILAVFEGVIETTGQPVQARTSYTEQDILWGHRFVTMVNFNKDKNIFDVDFSKLSTTEQIDTPLCSAAEYESVIHIISEEIS